MLGYAVLSCKSAELLEHHSLLEDVDTKVPSNSSFKNDG